MSHESKKIDPMIVLTERGIFDYHAFLVNPNLIDPELIKNNKHIPKDYKEENDNE